MPRSWLWHPFWKPQPGQARLSQGPGSVPVLVAANLGIPDGSPDIKDEFIWECKVTEPFIQSFCQFIWVPFVFSQLHHGGSCQGGEKMEAQMA